MSAGEPPIDSPEITRLTPVLGPGHTYASVTDKISAIVLTRPTSLGWYVGFVLAFSRFRRSECRHRRGLILQRRRHLGHQHSRRLGLRHRQLRLVDWYRSRRNTHFRDSLFAQPEMAHLDQPLCRSHDPLRRRLRRSFPAPSYGPPLVCVLACSRIPASWASGRNSAAR